MSICRILARCESSVTIASYAQWMIGSHVMCGDVFEEDVGMLPREKENKKMFMMKTNRVLANYGRSRSACCSVYGNHVTPAFTLINT